MHKLQQQVIEFHKAGEVPIGDFPQVLLPERIRLRVSLINEELKEYERASWIGDQIEIADALADLLYVVYGAAIEHGIDMEPICNEVHRSNMTKFPTIKREDGKVLKGPNFKRPNLAPLLYHQMELPFND